MAALNFFFSTFPFDSKRAVAMAEAWMNEEADALWQHFQRGPACVVNALPRQHAAQQKFPNHSLTTFFNAFAAEYLWRDKSKSGLEGLNRVLGNVNKVSAHHNFVLSYFPFPFRNRADITNLVGSPNDSILNFNLHSGNWQKEQQKCSTNHTYHFHCPTVSISRMNQSASGRRRR